MTINQLKIFDLAAKYSNLTRVARELRISQPSITKQLKALEEDYGVKLYTRSVQGIKLTTLGQRFRDAIKPILLQLHDVENLLSNHVGKGKTSSLTIAAGESPSVSLMPGLFKAFKQTHPKVQLFLRTGDLETLEQVLATDEVEIAITTTLPLDNRFISESFFSAEVVAVAASTSPLSKRKNYNLQELSTVPVISKVGRRISSYIEQQAGIKLNIVLVCESVEAVKAAVMADIGMGFLYRNTVLAELQSDNLREIKLPLKKHLNIKWYTMYKKKRVLSSSAKDFLALLDQTFRHQNDHSLLTGSKQQIDVLVSAPKHSKFN